MKPRRILKCSARVILVAVFLAFLWGFIGYWASTNDCDRKTASINPMKAIVHCEYGSADVLKLEDVERPVPNDDQVMIQVQAVSLNALDAYLVRDGWLNRLMFGLRKPKDTRLGHDVAGQVKAVGKNVTQFKVNDEVFGVCRGGRRRPVVSTDRLNCRDGAT